MSRWINLPEPPCNADAKTSLAWLLDAEELLSKTGRVIIERAAKEIELLKAENRRLKVHGSMDDVEYDHDMTAYAIDSVRPFQDGTCQSPQQGRTDNRLNICLIHDAGIELEACTCDDHDPILD